MRPGAVTEARDAVAAKRDGRRLGAEEIRNLVLGYARGDVPDYLAAAFLMAAYINGLSESETADLTRAMIDSGETLPLSGISRPKVDKHSTGGVSDGVTLVFAPLAASLGLAVAKLSGRGLGHTGGTLDKLEAIPGLRTDLTPEQFERQVQEIGCAVAGQSRELVPADGALYVLRDATATVASTPLIAASVMSKKLAVGTDLILLDVKAGSGAFMKTVEAAHDLAGACAALARRWGRRCRVAVTDMSQPLGSAIGNALDVAEAVRVLRGEEKGRLRDLSVLFAAEALLVLGGRDGGTARREAERALDSGVAAETLGRMIAAQGGDPRVVDDPWAVLPAAPLKVPVTGPPGYLAEVDAEALGRCAAFLGAGRAKKGDPIDPSVGVEFYLKVGDRIEEDRPIATLHAPDEDRAEAGRSMLLSAITVVDDVVEAPPLVYGWHEAEAPTVAAAQEPTGVEGMG